MIMQAQQAKIGVIQAYVRGNCRICEVAEKKLRLFLQKEGLEDQVEVEVLDVGLENGAAELDFYEVTEIPALLFLKDGKVVDRYEGGSPLYSQFNEGIQRLRGELAPKPSKEIC